MIYLGGQELEEPVELAQLAARAREEGRGINPLGGLDGPDIELELLPVSLYTPEHSDRVAELESRRQELDVVPYAPVDPASGIDEFEHEVRAAAACTGALFAGNGIDAVDEAIFLELRDRRVGFHARRV